MSIINFSHIADDIADGKCVLILGPDIVSKDSKTFFERMREYLVERSQDSNIIDHAFPNYFYFNEELLEVREQSNEDIVLRVIEEFYQQQDAFDEPLKKISRIPFNLIISLMPDDHLQRIFIKQNFKHTFDYFPIDGSRKQITEIPTVDNPLIYNLLGNIKDGQAVFTFEHMFNFLSQVLPEDDKTGLPDAVKRCLRMARTVIFLGVRFERWHAQLLLKAIQKDKKKKSISHFNESENFQDQKEPASTFITRRLAIELLGNDPEHFLDELYQKCIEKQTDQSRKERSFFRGQMLMPAIAKVFLSYSDADYNMVLKIANALILYNIEVIIDKSNMMGGEMVDDFILEKIIDSDIVIPIISKNSLFSNFVFEEISTAQQHKKYLLPCRLDNTHLDKDFAIIKRKNETVDEKLKLITAKIAENPLEENSHLKRQHTRWVVFRKDFSKVLDMLQNANCRLITVDGFDSDIAALIGDIKRKMGHG